HRRDVAADHWEASRHRFHDRESERFVLGREEKGVTCQEKFTNIIRLELAKKLYTSFNPLALDKRGEFISKVTFAGNQKACFGKRAHGANNNLLILLMVKPASRDEYNRRLAGLSM